MVPVGDKPILQHHLEWLARNGVTDAILLCGYMHEAHRGGQIVPYSLVTPSNSGESASASALVRLTTRSL
jgi:hypothetical protein